MDHHPGCRTSTRGSPHRLERAVAVRRSGTASAHEPSAAFHERFGALPIRKLVARAETAAARQGNRRTRVWTQDRNPALRTLTSIRPDRATRLDRSGPPATAGNERFSGRHPPTLVPLRLQRGPGSAAPARQGGSGTGTPVRRAHPHLPRFRSDGRTFQSPGRVGPPSWIPAKKQ